MIHLVPVGDSAAGPNVTRAGIGRVVLVGRATIHLVIDINGAYNS